MRAHGISTETERSRSRGQQLAGLVYFCTSNRCELVAHERRAMASLRRYCTRAHLLATSDLYSHPQLWCERDWPALLNAAHHFVFAASDDGTIARFVYEELSDARANGITVWFLTWHGQLVPCSAIRLEIAGSVDCTKYAQVWLTRAG